MVTNKIPRSFSREPGIFGADNAIDEGDPRRVVKPVDEDASAIDTATIGSRIL